MALENIKISQQEKDYLVKLKRYTGIKNWNVLCRWAFCFSLSDPIPPIENKIYSDSSVEMTWKVFGGEFNEIYMALLKERCQKDGFGTSGKELGKQFRLHLLRGINRLSAIKEIKNIESFFEQLISFQNVLQKISS